MGFGLVLSKEKLAFTTDRGRGRKHTCNELTLVRCSVSCLRSHTDRHVLCLPLSSLLPSVITGDGTQTRTHETQTLNGYYTVTLT